MDENLYENSIKFGIKTDNVITFGNISQNYDYRYAAPEDRHKARSELLKWLKHRISKFSVSYTFTLHQRHPSTRELLTQCKAEFVHNDFQRILNQAVFKNAAKRYGKTLNYFGVLETGINGNNLHLHGALGGFPDWYEGDVFMAIKAAALRTGWANEQMLIEAAPNLGWFSYITKTVTNANTDPVLFGGMQSE